MAETDLALKMRARADADGLASDHSMRVRADEFDAASEKFLAVKPKIDVRAFVGYWARARKAWCEYTGEPIL